MNSLVTRHRRLAAFSATILAMGVMLLAPFSSSSASATAGTGPTLSAPQPFTGCEGADDKKKSDGSCESAKNNGNGPVGSTSSSANNQSEGADKITICHATGSASNPFVVITISKNGLNGHGGHEKDIIPAPAGGCPTVTPTQLTASTSTAVTARLQNAGFVFVDTGTFLGSGRVVTINGVNFVWYVVPDTASTVALLQALPVDAQIWTSGNMVITPVPGTTVSTDMQTALLPQLGPVMTNQQALANAAAGAAPAPAPTGTGGLRDASSGMMLAIASLALVSMSVLALRVRQS